MGEEGQERPKWGKVGFGQQRKGGKRGAKKIISAAAFCLATPGILQLFIRNSVYATGSFGVSEADTVLIDKDILSAAHLLRDAKEQAPCGSAIG